ncbi:HK97 family phage prohead protease [Streptomyces sp. NBC_01214]|uniref:HK97 family phage prohead protease n=1 Tax=Streptomyces sp. NBC_01214 TaxID=2903777 RepID=UPI002259F542|nr:HK97 family phage prohead protease [Streptomyces sp. NBC_01214]MCX4801778.1 HK97 family phage prohead protease [Streptomyces sp. NBC_01214]
MRIKSCPVRIKAAGENEGTDDGVFEAIVAAYNVDSVGDKIMPGAFGETLDEWKSSGNPIPVLWSHMSHDPDYHIGEVLEAEERPEGLWVKARIDLDSPKAAQVYKLLKGRRVTQFSFAYDVLDGGPSKSKADDGESDSFELRKLKLYEVGPTLIGANQATELLDVKSADGATMRVSVEGASAAQTEELRQALTGAMAAKAGRTLSQKNEQRVKDIARLAKELLDSLSSSTDDDEKATPTPPVQSSPQLPAAKEAPAGPSPASLRQRDIDRLTTFEVEALSTLTG